MDSARLDLAVKSAIANENPLTKDMALYLNTDRVPLPAASAKAFWFEGNGNNIIYIDQENDIVAVVRWISTIPALNDVVGEIIASIKTPTQKDAAAR